MNYKARHKWAKALGAALFILLSGCNGGMTGGSGDTAVSYDFHAGQQG